ncbi:MAG: exosome complex protein Rrp42 [archaeon]|nr:exosome complex protein Rrp42 [archaeon]
MKVVPEISRRSITRLISEGKRVDGRSFDERRDIFIEPNVISKAEGSARVKLGDTQVIVGVKPSIGEPFADTPDVGVLMTNCELLPMAAPEFEPGPPSPESIELARVVDRGIRESQLVDLEKLCIEEGKKVWMLFIDIHVIDYDGNLFDAANLAVMAALMNTKLPIASYVDDEVVLDEENFMELPVRDKLALSTFVKIGDGMVLDPSLDEEEILDARITIGVTDKGNNICSMQKGGDVPLTRDEILDAVHMAFTTKDDLLRYLN